MASRFADVPILVTAATADKRSDLGEIEKTGATGSLVAWLARTFIQTWVATTAAVDEALIRAGVEPGKINRIPNGVTLPEELNIERRAARVRRFLYLGRISTNANRDVPTLVRAFDRLATNQRDLELAIVGGGDLFDSTQRLAETCAARNRIHMPGFDRPEKWLAWADCFVLPSRKEGLSIALLEAMAVGLPCIANDIPQNCEALEAAMRGMVENDELARHFARKAKERIKQCYSIESVAARYVILYESLRGRSENTPAK
jgi:glycosyltransferase involved in cell wall biosynthesis